MSDNLKRAQYLARIGPGNVRTQLISWQDALDSLQFYCRRLTSEEIRDLLVGMPDRTVEALADVAGVEADPLAGYASLEAGLSVRRSFQRKEAA